MPLIRFNEHYLVQDGVRFLMTEKLLSRGRVVNNPPRPAGPNQEGGLLSWLATQLLHGVGAPKEKARRG
jgi:hypothetical protein